MIELAIAHPIHPEDFDRLRTFSAGFSKSDMAEELIHVIQEALADDPSTFEQPILTKQLTPAERNLAEFLHLALGVICEEHQVAPKLIASNDDINTFVQTQTAPF